jgi:hypothetical protein
MLTQVDTTYQPRFTSSELSASITERIKELAQATDEARMTEEMCEYLETCAKFHQYSSCNVMCILLTCPHATNVAGYQKWRTFNRYVCKGEQGIPILAPIFVQENPDDPTSKCLDGTLRCYTDDPRKAEDIYNAGPYSGEENENMPSVYASQGNYEDYAETFRVTVVSALVRWNNAEYKDAANLVYGYSDSNYNIGKRHDVMKAIINGAWSLWKR